MMKNKKTTNTEVLYKYWLENIPKEFKDELLDISEQTKYENFHTSLDFGTAGIRGKMGLGPNKINRFLISQNSYAFGKALIKLYGKKALKHGIVIFHDNRKFGKDFSLIAAQTLSALGIPVVLPKDNKLSPTPFLSYLISNNDFVGGINITASHNPKEYNGFKIYDETGKQADDEIIALLHEYTPKKLFEIESNNDKVGILDSKYEKEYLDRLIKDVPLKKEQDRNNLVVIYGTNHGTALSIGEKVLKKTKVSYHIVSEQSFPSETFENVEFPNPQDIRSFELSKKYGDKYNADVLFLTDPDADRFGAMVKHKNEWVYLNGNQLPFLQIQYKIEQLSKQKNIDFSNFFVVRSIVTSRIADQIVKENGIEIFDSLTGFRSIFKVVEEQIKLNKKMFFAWEESNGSVVEPFVKDKDSFQSLYQITEMIFEHKKSGKTLVDILEESYDKYGYYIMDQVQKAFDSINGSQELQDFIAKYRKLSIGDELFGKKIKKIVDYKNGFQKFKPQNILFIYFENDSYICLRPSGTEPILRIYFDLKGEKRAILDTWFSQIKKELS